MLLGAALIIGPQLLGGLPGWATTGIALTTCAAAVASRSGAGPPTPLAIGALLGVVWTGLQALPLPLGLLSGLAPLSVERSRAIARVVGEDVPALAPLSLSPAETRASVVTGIAILGAVLAGTHLSRLGRAKTVLAILAASGATMAGVGLFHAIADMTLLFGVYEPTSARPPFLSPLLNPNHFAGFMTLCAPVAIGLALEAERRDGQLGWSSAAALMVLAGLMTGSRGGVASIAAALLVLVAALAAGRGRQRKAAAAGAALLGLAALGLGLTAASTSISEEYLRGGYEKFELITRALDLIAQRPLLGVGRGAFSEAFVTIYVGSERFDHPESIGVQWAADWGIPFALLLAALVVAAFKSSRELARGPARMGALAGLIGLVLHELVDFATELPGIVVPAAAALAAVSAGRRTSGQVASGRARALVVGAFAGAAVVAFTLGVRIERESVARLVADMEGAQGTTAFWARADEATRLHPSEPLVAVIAAHEATRQRHPAALRWLNRAMTLAPLWSAPHEVAARFLASRGAWGQAWLELRQAEELSPRRAWPTACALWAAHPDPEATARALGGDEAGRSLLGALGTCGGVDADVRERMDELLAAQGVPPAVLRQASRLVRGHEADAALALLAQHDLPDPAGTMARADALVALDRHDEAITLLADLPTENLADRRSVLTSRARALSAAGRLEQMRETVSLLRASSGGQPAELARVAMLTAELESRAGNPGHALRALEEAYRLTPDQAVADQLAALAERSGRLDRAYLLRRDRCRGTDTSRDCTEAQRLARLADERPGLRPQRLP